MPHWRWLAVLGFLVMLYFPSLTGIADAPAPAPLANPSVVPAVRRVLQLELIEAIAEEEHGEALGDGEEEEDEPAESSVTTYHVQLLTLGGVIAVIVLLLYVYEVLVEQCRKRLPETLKPVLEQARTPLRHTSHACTQDAHTPASRTPAPTQDVTSPRSPAELCAVPSCRA